MIRRRTCKNITIRQTVKWSNHLIKFLARKTFVGMHALAIEHHKQKLGFGSQKNKTVCFLPRLLVHTKKIFVNFFFQAKVSRCPESRKFVFGQYCSYPRVAFVQIDFIAVIVFKRLNSSLDSSSCRSGRSF